MITHGDLFAGVGGFSEGFRQAGLHTAWHVENDPACQSVLRRHNSAPIYGDVCQQGGHTLTPVDVISFGSPCQGLSIAGKREGLADDRSILFYEGIRIIRELQPAVAVWENVPGAFSSDDGRDFASVLLAFRQCGARDLAWATLDAQYFGVPQRRRRVFLVADFRGERAAEILFESLSRAGDFAAGTEARPDLAPCLESGANRTGGVRPPGTTVDTAESLIVGTLSASGAGTARTGNARSEADMLVQVAGAQSASHGGADDNDAQAGHLVGALMAHPSRLDAHEVGSGHLVAAPHTVGVRRLTPLECERLQGFPDGWTKYGLNPLMDWLDIEPLRFMQSDSARYRQLGNAVCVPVAKWIGQQIVRVWEAA